jgi:hypothetical protein
VSQFICLLRPSAQQSDDRFWDLIQPNPYIYKFKSLGRIQNCIREFRELPKNVTGNMQSASR